MKDTKEMRRVYCESLIELGKKNKNICLLEADLMGSSGTADFFKTYPNRSINVGIAEANMVGVAAGLAASGKIPFCTTFTPFITRRCLDQLEISVCYSDLNVKITGTDPGIMATNNGGTHMSVDDVGIMRGIPGMSIFEPVDAAMLKKAMPQIVKYEKPMYIRLFRKLATTVFDDSLKFDLFKGIDIEKGKDVTIIASGIMVSKAIKAREILKEEGYSVGVLSIHTIKPIDKEAIVASAKRSGALVTAENHSVINGLGSAVSEIVVQECPVPVRMVGIQDRFGEVGNEEYLTKEMNLTVEDIVKAAKEAMAAK